MKRFASSLAAALLDSLFAHPAGYSDADTARELIAAYCAAIEFFRSLLIAGCRALRMLVIGMTLAVHLGRPRWYDAHVSTDDLFYLHFERTAW